VRGYPGFRYVLDWGFTTWPERYVEFDPAEQFPDRSYNHPMQSGFAAWFHESLGGIQPGSPGFKHLELKPHGFTRLEWLKTSHESPYGLIRSDWRSKDGQFEWSINVPPNTTATVHVPATGQESVRESGKSIARQRGIRFVRQDSDRVVFEVESGSYEFKAKL